MATKPVTLPAWNTGGANNVVPSAGEKISGWTVGQVPPSSYFNWFQKLVYEWTAYLDDLAAQAFTWTAAHVFSNTVNFNGLATFSARANVISAPGASNANIRIENLDTTNDSNALRALSSSVGTTVRIQNSSTGRGLQVQTTDGAGSHVWLVPNTILPPSPTEGDMVYLGGAFHKLYVYDGTAWNACW